MDNSGGSPWTTAGLHVDGTDAFGTGIFEPVLKEATRAELMDRISALEGKLATLPALEQANGALMVTYGINADAAFALLRFHSQNRNVKVRSIAAQLTTLMCTSPSSTEAIIRFDRLLDEVSRSLQTTVPGRRESASTAATDPATAAFWPGIAPNDLAHVMLQSVATVPPGITIAAYAPGMPLIYTNDAFTEITGYTRTDILGQNCRFLQGPETDPDVINRLRGALRRGRDLSVTLRNYRRDGTPFWNEISVSPLRDRTDKITHYIGTQVDVTEATERQETATTG